MKNNNVIHGLITESQGELADRMREAFDKGFEQGLKDNSDEAYQRGSDDAWEAAGKIYVMFYKDIEKIFGKPSGYYVYLEFSASEAIAKIKAYEEQKKAEEEKIKVGDEVVGQFGFRGVVVGIDLPSNRATILSTKYTVPQMYPLNDISRKIGRHFPQIAEVLKQLQEGE